MNNLWPEALIEGFQPATHWPKSLPWHVGDPQLFASLETRDIPEGKQFIGYRLEQGQIPEANYLHGFVLTYKKGGVEVVQISEQGDELIDQLREIADMVTL